MAIGFVFLKLVGAGADALDLVRLLPRLLGGEHRHDDLGLAEIIHEQRPRHFQLERDGVGIRCRDFGHVIEITTAHAHAHVPLDRGFGIGRCQDLAVVEGDALPDLEGVGQAV
ncbi:MAG: hypothetical protein WCO90_12850 [Planctomycetota bacterium]